MMNDDTQGTSAEGQDPQGLEAKPAGPVPEGHAPDYHPMILGAYQGDVPSGEPDLRKLGEAEIDAAARYLRETQQSGKVLMPWAKVSNSAKKKWLVLAEGTLRAAWREATR